MFFVFRYEKELGDSRWSTVRKGAVYGLYIGWLFFVTYIIYSVGFIFGSIFIESDSETEFDISDILVVSISSKDSEEQTNLHFFSSFRLFRSLQYVQIFWLVSVPFIKHFQKVELQQQQFFESLMR